MNVPKGKQEEAFERAFSVCIICMMTRVHGSASLFFVDCFPSTIPISVAACQCVSAVFAFID